MNRMRTATVVAMLAGAVSLGGLAAQAQSPGQGSGQRSGADSAACLGAMRQLMTMMSDHMGTSMMGSGSEPGGGMMGQGSDTGGGMMGPGASARPGMMGAGSGMGPGMMGPASSPGAMGSTDDGCLALMGQMMGMMRDHMADGVMGPRPTSAPTPSSHDAHHPGTTDPATPTASAAATVRVEVTLTDAFRIEPAAMTVPAGVPVTFVVTNSGVIPHEFVVGDEAYQEAHAATMQGMASMAHDDADAIGVAPGVTKELTITFARPGVTLAGCHVPGHYAAGMQATITVTA